VCRLGPDRPSRVDRLLVAIARVSAIEAARQEMSNRGLEPDPRTSAELEASERAAHQEMADLDVEERRSTASW
jgi:hypothetical protein